MEVIRIASLYKSRPSEILAIDCVYTAYCFDEAVARIQQHLEAKEKPRFVEQKDNQVTYSSFTAFYASYGVKGGI